MRYTLMHTHNLLITCLQVLGALVGVLRARVVAGVVKVARLVPVEGTGGLGRFARGVACKVRMLRQVIYAGSTQTGRQAAKPKLAG